MEFIHFNGDYKQIQYFQLDWIMMSSFGIHLLNKEYFYLKGTITHL